jgi:hypothetical protein
MAFIRQCGGLESQTDPANLQLTRVAIGNLLNTGLKFLRSQYPN